MSPCSERAAHLFDDIDLLGRMVDAMICKVAVMLPDSNRPDTLREHAQKVIDSLLGAFRRKPRPAGV